MSAALLKILIADDHPLVRQALAQAIELSLGATQIIEISNYSDLEEALRRDENIDLLLLDLHMPGTSGFAGLLTIRAEFPTIPVVVVTASEETDVVSRAMSFGAAGFIPKSARIEVIGQAVKAVLNGECWTPGEWPPGKADCPTNDLHSRLAKLTPQQLRVLLLINAGKLNKQIAYEMNISLATVKAHVTAILEKLKVGSRTQAVIAAHALLVEDNNKPGR